MLIFGRRFKFLSLIILLVGSMGILSSCASKKKDYTAKTNPFPYNVVAVDVSSLDPTGDEFARQLEFSLKQAVGGPALDASRDVRLQVQTHPNGVLDRSVMSLFRQITSLNGASVTATVRLLDGKTGNSVKYDQITSSSSKDDIQVANIFIAEDMIAQIRAILGLTIYPPRPVSFIASPTKQIPAEKEKPEPIPKPQLQYADPLLNGQITPETETMDLIKQIKESDEKMSTDSKVMKKKVNNEAKMVRDILKESMTAPEKEVMKDKNMSSGEKMVKTMMDDSGEAKDTLDDDGALCIVTVENDCLGVGINQ